MQNAKRKTIRNLFFFTLGKFCVMIKKNTLGGVSMEIRFAEIGDVPGILALLRQVGQVHHEGRPDIFRAGAQKYGASQVIAMLNKPGSPIFVAAQGGVVLGYCFCMMKKHEKDPVIADHRELYIDDLCVDENCRGQHIGKSLYETACRYAAKTGCRSVTLNVWTCNESAMAFYEKLGMKPQKIGMEYILEDENAR